MHERDQQYAGSAWAQFLCLKESCLHELLHML